MVLCFVCFLFHFLITHFVSILLYKSISLQQIENDIPHIV